MQFFLMPIKEQSKNSNKNIFYFLRRFNQLQKIYKISQRDRATIRASLELFISCRRRQFRPTECELNERN